jgi:diguanylate cyclase (GGDEF)-like protein
MDEKGVRLCLTDLCPASRVFRSGKTHEQELYLHHKDGHRVYVLTRITPMLDSNGNLEGAVEIFSDNTSTVMARRRVERLRKLTLLDPVTELGNRRYGMINLSSRLGELKRYDWKFGVIFMDIDRFKNVNDTYGHETGDKVLKMVANTLSRNCRRFDIFCRWGGEEFLGIIANVNEADLFLIADRFRRLVEESSFKSEKGPIKVTVSVGATVPRPDDTAEGLIKRADELMYHSKSAGLNRVSMK